MIWYISAAFLVCIWSLSALWCDIQSANFLLNHNLLVELIFFTNVFSGFGACAVCFVVGGGSLRKLYTMGNALRERPAMRNLLITVGFLNVLSTFMVYYSFSLAGITHVYALKATEPLVMCLLSTDFLQKIRRRMFSNVSPKSPYVELEEYNAQMRPVTLLTWFAVFLVCVGASLVCASLVRSEGQFLETNTIVLGYLLIFASNFTLALRTMLQKPLLHVVPDLSGIFVSSGIYMFTSFFGACALLLPMIIRIGNFDRFDKLVWERIFVVGISYCSYQICNGTILFFISPVSYAVLKQVRVVLIFLFSAYYFEKTFSSIPQLVVGIILLFIGNLKYAAN